MASMSEFPFLRRPRLASTPKIRPIMKLEWNKLLAEATEKDFELNQEPLDKEANYDDDVYDVEPESETNENVYNGEKNEERPLNLCYKSHTIPSMGNKFQNPLDVLDLSAGRKIVENTDNRKHDSVKKTFCKVHNFQLNQVNSEVPNTEKKNINEPFIENKENFLCNNNNNNNNNNIKNIFSTPCNSKPFINERGINEGRSCSKKENQLISKPVFYSERKQMPSLVSEKIEEGNHLDKGKSCSKKESQSNSKPDFLSDEKPVPGLASEKNSILSKENVIGKPDLSVKEKKSTPNKKKSSSGSNASVQERSVVDSKTSLSEKFAIPVEPAKPTSKTLVINKKIYQILAPIGKGGSSKVYLVLNSENEILAVKCVKLSNVPESTKNGYLNEIQHLKKMQHSKHVIKLYDYQYLNSQKLLFAVMERGDTDLSRFLKDKASSNEGISPELIMYYWTEMLLAVKSIHDNNIIHRDLKPANFLLVSGRLKLIDFGIASSIQTEQTSVLMETQSGTFNYMSPEALQDLGLDNKMVLKIGRKTDVWSLGCILYSFLYKKTPYQDIVKPIHKMRAITDSNHQVPFPKIPGVPDILIESCKRCLIHDTKKRASIEELLAFKNRPLLSLSQVLGKLESVLSPEEFEKAAKAFENVESEN